MNSEALKTIEESRATKKTRKGMPEEIRSLMDSLAPDGWIDIFWKLRESLDTEEQTLLTLRLEKDVPWEEVAEVMRADGEPATLDALRERFERVMMKLQRLAREQGLIE